MFLRPLGGEQDAREKICQNCADNPGCGGENDEEATAAEERRPGFEYRERRSESNGNW